MSAAPGFEQGFVAGLLDQIQTQRPVDQTGAPYGSPYLTTGDGLPVPLELGAPTDAATRAPPRIVFVSTPRGGQRSSRAIQASGGRPGFEQTRTFDVVIYARTDDELATLAALLDVAATDALGILSWPATNALSKFEGGQAQDGGFVATAPRTIIADFIADPFTSQTSPVVGAVELAGP